MNGEFAVSLTDMGHSGGMMDASWALDAQKRIDFAYRAQHVTANLRADEMPVLLQNPLALLHRAIIPHCPPLSGVSDGLLENLSSVIFPEPQLSLVSPHSGT